MSKIGIFWVYKNQIIGKARELSEGEETYQSMIDSPDSHVGLWEEDKSLMIQFPELVDSEYQDIPRGRVIYSTKLKTEIVYMDKKLHKKESRKIVSEFFGLDCNKVIWRTDPHYTTDMNEIDNFFNES